MVTILDAYTGITGNWIDYCSSATSFYTMCHLLGVLSKETPLTVSLNKQKGRVLWTLLVEHGIVCPSHSMLYLFHYINAPLPFQNIRSALDQPLIPCSCFPMRLLLSKPSSFSSSKSSLSRVAREEYFNYAR